MTSLSSQVGICVFLHYVIGSHSETKAGLHPHSLSVSQALGLQACATTPCTFLTILLLFPSTLKILFELSFVQYLISWYCFTWLWLLFWHRLLSLCLYTVYIPIPLNKDLLTRMRCSSARTVLYCDHGARLRLIEGPLQEPCPPALCPSEFTWAVLLAFEIWRDHLLQARARVQERLKFKEGNASVAPLLPGMVQDSNSRM